MKIGIIGTAHTIQKILSTINFEEIFIETREYPCRLEEVAELLDNIQKELDAILFTGNLYYAYACRSTSASIPWTYAKQSSSSVLRALFRAVISGIDISKVTYDLDNTTVGQMAELLSREAGLENDSVNIYRYNDSDTYLNYLERLGADEKPVSREPMISYSDSASTYHLENLAAGRANICVSGTTTVVERVQAEGYPAFLVKATADDLVIALNELRVRHHTYKQRNRDEYQMAVFALSIQLSDVFSSGIQEYRQLFSYHQIESNVYAFAQSIGAAVEKQANGCYLIYSTKAEVDVVTDSLENGQFLKRLQSITNVKYVTLGIGFAFTHGAAKNNAQYCDMVAKKQKRSCYYMMGGSDTAPVGPFSIGTEKGEKEFEDLRIERISREVGVGVVVLNMLLKAQAQYGFNAVTANTLAEMCGMTVSNMNRIITKLEAKGYASVVGYQPNSGAGRPSRLICLKL